MKSIKKKKMLSFILALALFLTSSVPAFAASAFISENEAQTIVLAHAGVAVENAVFTKTKFDKKTNTYKIKFTCEEDKYEYELNAIDGSILDYEWDIEDDEHHASSTDPDQRPDYGNNIQAAEASALARLGIAREDVKYINSYVKYDEYHNACAIHVEIGIYDRSVSPQTVVYSFDFSMDGEIVEQPAPVEPVNPSEPEPVEPAPVEPVNPSEPEPVEPAPVEPVNPEQPDYSENLQAAEASSLAELGISREDAKYINSYVKYDESHTACAIQVEVGIYDKTISPQTIVYRFAYNMEGEIIERPAPAEPVPVEPEPVEPEPAEPEPVEPEPVEPEPVEPAPADPKPVVPVTPAEPDKSDEADSGESQQPETTKPDKKKISTKSIKVNKTTVKLKKGKKFTIKVTRTPKSATDKITYSTNKKKVATVSKKGVVTAKSKGSCKITVKCNGKKKVIKITVK